MHFVYEWSILLLIMIKLPKLSLPRLKLSPVAVLLVVAGMLVSLAAGASYYFYRENKRVTGLLENPTEAARVEVRSTVARVGKLMVLPTDEEPTLATVIDPQKLADQPFFAKAKSGDKVLIYTTNKKAILYRPGDNKILEVAPITIGQGQTPSEAVASQPTLSPTLSPTPSQNVRVALLNGTDTTGLTTKVETTLKDTFPEIAVASKENANVKTHEKTLVVDVTGGHASLARKIAGQLSGEVTAIPAGETVPQPEGSPVDILVILGSSFTGASPTPTP